MPNDPFDIGSGQGGDADFFRNLMAFGSQMSMAANARTPQGFLQYGNGIAGPLGAGIQGALGQSMDTAKLRSSLGLQNMQRQNIGSEIESRGLQNQMMQQQLDLMRQFGGPQETMNPFAGEAAPGGVPGPQSDATPASGGGGYRGATYSDAIFGGEGSGKNPRSSAQGYGGFIDGTWQKFSQANPHFFVGMTPEQVMQVRTDPQIGPILGKEAVNWLAKENAPLLEREGVPVNGQSLALAHRLDPVSAVAVMKAPANMPMPEVLMKGFVPVFGQDGAVAKTTAYLKANPDLVANKDGIAVTAGDVRAKFAAVPAPEFVTGARESKPDDGMPQSARFASVGNMPMPTAAPVDPGAGMPMQAPPQQMAQAAPMPQPAAPVMEMPRPDPRLLAEINRLNNQARALAAAKMDPRPALQEAGRLSELAYAPMKAWMTEQAKTQFAGPRAAAESQASLPAELAKQGFQLTPGGGFKFIAGGPADPAQVGAIEAAKRQQEVLAEFAKQHFRQTPDGGLTPIKGGLADPAQIAAKAGAEAGGRAAGELPFVGPRAAAIADAELPAKLSALGFEQTPNGGQQFIKGGRADPAVVGAQEAAKRREEMIAAIGTKQATTAIETAEVGKQVAIREAAQQLFGPEGTKRYEGANQTIGWTEKMEAAFNKLNTGDAWSTTGTGAQWKMEMAKSVNSFLETMGAKPVFDEKKVASWEQLKKETQTAGMELLTSLFGGAREAASTIVNATAAVPSDANTPAGAMKVLNGIREAAKHQIDRRNYMIQAGEATGDYRKVGEEFDKKFPPSMYARRAMSMVDPFKIKDQSELARFLPGTVVITPDGQRRVIPGPTE